MPVLLICHLLDEANVKNLLRSRENHALAYLSSFLTKHGIKTEITNAHLEGLNSDAVIKRMASQRTKPELIGINCIAERSYPYAKELIEKIREAGFDSHITMGGQFPSFAPNEILLDLPELDSIIRGEGEYTLLGLVRAIYSKDSLCQLRGISYRKDSEIRNNPNQEPIRNLDELPFADRSQLSLILALRDPSECIARIIASRGCSYHCTFCTTPGFHGVGHRRTRSPKHVVSEMEMVVNDYGVSTFKFDDDIFMDSTEESIQWVNEFIEEIKRRTLKTKFRVQVRTPAVQRDIFMRLKEIGLCDVLLGAEFATERQLEQHCKKATIEDNERAISILRNQGINIRVTFIMFEPDETWDELYQNYYWLKKMDCANKMNLGARMNVYHGTSLARRLERKSRVSRKYLGDRWGYSFSDKRVSDIYDFWEENQRILEKPGKILRELMLELKERRYREELNRDQQNVIEVINNELNTLSEAETQLDMYIFENALLAFKKSSHIDVERIDKARKEVEKRKEEWENRLGHLLETLGEI